MIKAVGIGKAYYKKTVIDNFSIEIEQGEFIAITGESGTGKTTLLNLLSLLEKPDSGDVIVDGHKNPNRKQTMLLQRNLLAYLFQNYALIENETVEKNLEIALSYRKNIDKNASMKNALARVDLEGFLKRKIFELSGGEQQRVALARVYLKECAYVFADEPTGNLDKRNRNIVFDILKDLNHMGKTVIYVTHDEDLAQRSSRRINLSMPKKTPTSIGVE